MAIYIDFTSRLITTIAQKESLLFVALMFPATFAISVRFLLLTVNELRQVNRFKLKKVCLYIYFMCVCVCTHFVCVCKLAQNARKNRIELNYGYIKFMGYIKFDRP